LIFSDAKRQVLVVLWEKEPMDVHLLASTHCVAIGDTAHVGRKE
jgi:hypothetical protein